MIPAVAPIRQPPAWQRALKDAITDPAGCSAAVAGPGLLHEHEARVLQSIPQLQRLRVHTRLPGCLVPRLVREKLRGAARSMVPPASR
jgi:hypothetical protein